MSRRELLMKLKDQKKLLKQKETEIGVQTEIIKTANKAKANSQNEHWNIVREIERLNELLIVESGLNANLAELRKIIVQKMVRVRRKDITVADKERLENEIAQLTIGLQKICPHNFVIVISDSYYGSSSMDYDDGCFGFRRCVVCGFGERSLSTKEEHYEALSESESRLIKRDPRTCGFRTPKYNPDEIWENLDVFLKMFERSAGNMNAEWQDKKNT